MNVQTKHGYAYIFMISFTVELFVCITAHVETGVQLTLKERWVAHKILVYQL
ncbi:MAG: hypothetical protein NVS2B12_05420 [Ktedonobacteraceae bacterium]